MPGKEKEPLAHAKVSAKNQISIPKAVAQELNISKGDIVLFFKTGDQIIVKKGRVVSE